MGVLIHDTTGNLFSTDDARMIWELKPYNVCCKDCKRTDSGSQMELEQREWSLTWRGEVCGTCVAIDRQFEAVIV